MLLLISPIMPEGGFNSLDVSQGGNYLWTLIIFVLACPFIWKLVMGPVTRALEERDANVQRAIEAAQKAAADAERSRAEVESRLAEARAESARVMAEARARAEVREKEILAAASTEAKSLLEGARRAIQAEQDKAISAIRDEVVDIALSAAKAVISKNVDS